MKLQEWLESVASPEASVTVLRAPRGPWVAQIWEPLRAPVKGEGRTLADALTNLKDKIEHARHQG